MPQDSAGSKALSREPSMEIEYDESADEIFDPDDSQAADGCETCHGQDEERRPSGLADASVAVDP